ncbi:hypothetical protein ACFLUP_00910 [Chloroflexota bacterium]
MEETGKHLRASRIIHILLLLGVLSFIDVSWRIVPPLLPLVSVRDNTHNLIIIVLVILGIISWVYGYFFPRLIQKTRTIKTRVSKGRLLFGIHVAHAAMFESTTVYGVILAILGVSWQIVTPFFIATVAGLLLIFPTESKWNEMAAIIESRMVNTTDE